MTDKDSVPGRLLRAGSRFGWTLVVILLITLVALALMGILSLFVPLFVILGGTIDH